MGSHLRVASRGQGVTFVSGKTVPSCRPLVPRQTERRPIKAREGIWLLVLVLVVADVEFC